MLTRQWFQQLYTTVVICVRGGQAEMILSDPDFAVLRSIADGIVEPEFLRVPCVWTDNSHPDEAHKAACPSCNPTLTVPELNAAYARERAKSLRKPSADLMLVNWLLTPEALEIGRKAIEDALIEWRDARLSELGRNNGCVVKEKDGTASNVIRFGPEKALRIGLKAMLEAHSHG